MSESIFKSKPSILTPVYNDVFAIVESENSELDGFRYRYKIEVDDVEVAKGKVLPMPDGDGKINMSRILQSFLSYKELFPIGSVNNIVKGSYVKAKLTIGEQYNPNAWVFNKFTGLSANNPFWINSDNPLVNPNGLTRTALYNDTLVEPNFEIGDLIEITQNEPIRTQLQGVQKVIDIQLVDDTWNGNYIGYIAVLELTWIGFGSPSGGNGGSVVTSVITKVITEDIDSYEFSLWNGALPFMNFKGYDVNEWNATDGAWKFMTSAPRDGYPVREDSAVFLQFGNQHNNNHRLEIKSGANSARTANIAVSEDVNMVDVSFERDTLGFVVGTYPLNSDTKEYTAQIIGDLTVSELFKFKVNRRCYEFEDVEICFLDRLGSIMPFAFNLKKDKQATVERVNYTKDVDTNTMYDYSLMDGGEIPVDLNETIRYILRTDAINEAMGNYLRELVSSPFTVVRFGDGEYQRCNVITNSLAIRSKFDEGLNFYEIQIELSNNDKVNW